MLDLWYKNAIVYCLDVETFMDSNGDGIGDFGGLADRLDHIEALGATCVWLLPFHPSPNRGLPEHLQPKDDPHEYLTELRDFIAWRRAEGMMLAEANITMNQVDEYFGDGDRLHVIFNFMLNQHTFLALARKDAEPIRRVMAKTPPIPPKAQWGTFLRNHDELDLGRLEEEERQEVFRLFGPEPHMQAYERGIRRRLAPMLGGDQARIMVALSLMFALPGMPVIWYGDEIGMGDDLSLEERNSVRTPMQWSDEPNAGFSTAAADRLARPVVSDGAFAYERVNAQAQRDVSGSLFETVQRLVRVRRACLEIGWGECQVLETEASNILALRSDWRGGTVITLHNLSDEKATVRLPLEGVEQLRLLYCNGTDRAIRAADEPIEVEAYGFRWFRAGGERR